MLDPAAVVVSILGEHATAAPDVDWLDDLPVLVVEVLEQTPVTYTDHLSSCVAEVQVNVFDTSRAEALAAAWDGAKRLITCEGARTPYGAVSWADIVSQPTPTAATASGGASLFQFTFIAQLTLQTEESNG